MNLFDALRIAGGLVAIGLGAVFLALCLAAVLIILAAGRHAAGQVEKGERP